MEASARRRSDLARAAIALFGLLALLAPGVAFADGEKTRLRKYEAKELERLVRSEGYGSVRMEDDDTVVFKAEGSQYVLFLLDDGDLQLYYGITGVNVSTDDINLWNRGWRLSRAYLDRDSDPVLEADLLANAGMNDRIITEFIKVFVGSAADFRAFLREHDRPAATPEPTPASPARGI